MVTLILWGGVGGGGGRLNYSGLISHLRNLEILLKIRQMFKRMS